MTDDAEGRGGGGLAWIRARLPGVLVEVVSVVFAVLVALGFDEWRQHRELDQRAEAARTAVLAELRSNRDDLNGSEAGMRAMSDTLRAAIAAMSARAPSGVGLHLNLDLPDFSEAAWRITQGSEAATRLELGWLIRVSRAYELQETYDVMRQEVVHTMATINAEDPGTVLPHLLGELGILLQYQDQLDARYAALLDPQGEGP